MYAHEGFESNENYFMRALFVVGFEVAMFFLAIFFGPFFTWRAALTLAKDAITGGTGSEGTLRDQREAEKHQLYNKVLVLIEACLEGAMQLILQGNIFRLHPTTIDPVGCISPLHPLRMRKSWH